MSKIRRLSAKFFISMADSEKIPSEVQPKNWSRFVDNVYATIQVLGGTKPTGRNDRRLLPQLNRVLTILDEYFSTLTPEQFPRSLSLFQITVGCSHLNPSLQVTSTNTTSQLGTNYQRSFQQRVVQERTFRSDASWNRHSEVRLSPAAKTCRITFIDLKVLTNLTKDDQLLAATRRLTGLRASVKRRRRATRELSVGSPNAVAGPTERG
jgi:hypothetical protein